MGQDQGGPAKKKHVEAPPSLANGRSSPSRRSRRARIRSFIAAPRGRKPGQTPLLQLEVQMLRAVDKRRQRRTIADPPPPGDGRKGTFLSRTPQVIVRQR